MTDKTPVTTEIDRVIDQSSARTFSVPAVLMPSWQPVMEELVFQSPVPVVGTDLKTHVGFATVYREGDRVLAELFLNYSTPERLDIEEKKPIYALPLMESTFNTKGEFSHVAITQVQLLSGKPIGPLVPVGEIL